MKLSSETENLFTALRKSAKPKPVSAIEKLIEDAPDRDLCRINALAFAARHKLNEEDVIAAFLHGARLGIFDMSWNILCPACGGVLDSGATLKTVKQAEYRCVLCADGVRTNARRNRRGHVHYQSAGAENRGARSRDAALDRILQTDLLEFRRRFAR